MGNIWLLGQNPSLIFTFWYKYTYLDLFLTYFKKKKFLTVFLYKIPELGTVACDDMIMFPIIVVSGIVEIQFLILQ